MRSIPGQLQTTLKTLQAYLSAAAGRPLRQTELAAIAEMNPRSFGEWMRGATSPAGVQALLRLLSEVPPQALSPLLDPWKEGRLQALAARDESRSPIRVQANQQSVSTSKQRRRSTTNTVRRK